MIVAKQVGVLVNAYTMELHYVYQFGAIFPVATSSSRRIRFPLSFVSKQLIKYNPVGIILITEMPALTTSAVHGQTTGWCSAVPAGQRNKTGCANPFRQAPRGDGDPLFGVGKKDAEVLYKVERQSRFHVRGYRISANWKTAPTSPLRYAGHGAAMLTLLGKLVALNM